MGRTTQCFLGINGREILLIYTTIGSMLPFMEASKATEFIQFSRQRYRNTDIRKFHWDIQLLMDMYREKDMGGLQFTPLNWYISLLHLLGWHRITGIVICSKASDRWDYENLDRMKFFHREYLKRVHTWLLLVNLPRGTRFT